MYNLVEVPWLPVVWNNGTPPSAVGLRELLHRTHEITEVVTDNPMETVALNRMLAALVASVFPKLSDDRGWFDVWAAEQLDTDQIDAYLYQYADRFDLLSSTRPFFGHPITDTKSISPLTRLQHAATSGNNAALFSHDLDEQPVPASLAEAARWMVCAQAAALGGGVAQPFNLSHAPLVGGAVFWIRGLTGEGPSLFRALLLNLVPSSKIWGDEWIRKEDQATWEPDAPPSPQKRDALGLRDLLTFQSRRLRLELDDQGKAIGVHYNQGSKLEETPLRDPHMAYKEGKQGLYPLSLSASRALWRDSAVFLMTSRNQASGNDHAPRTFEWLSNYLSSLKLSKQTAFAVDVFGLVNDQAKVELWQQERLLLFPALLEDADRWAALSGLIATAEDYGKNRLRESVRAFASRARFGKPWGTRLGDIERRERDDFVKMLAADAFYWPPLGEQFSPYLARLAGQPIDTLNRVSQDWKKLVRRTGRQALQRAVEPFAQDDRSLQALAESEIVLFYGTLYPKTKSQPV